MPDSLAQYACDTCRSRKVACSRDRSGCQRCKAEGANCSYSRSGIIRRGKKPKHPQDHKDHKDHNGGGLQPSSQPTGTSDNTANTTSERLRGLLGGNHPSLRQLASLLEEYAAVWQATSASGQLAEDAVPDFYLFDEDQARVWVDAFVAALQAERLLLTSVPSGILQHLAASHPHEVHDRAWLVMFYSVALRHVCSAAPSDEITKAKLRSNLWLAFNDVRLLLEPNPSSIQALVMMACYLEEYMTPQLSWSLISQACIMLQASGISHWRLDAATLQHRTMLFWKLNVLDKALALILARPPTLHRELTAAISLPTLDQLLLPRVPRGTPALFNAHYSHQMHLLSRIMGDVWHCLYGQESNEIDSVKHNLESWNREATEAWASYCTHVLKAAALAEKLLLTASGVATVELGLRTQRFHYYYLLLLLTVSCKSLRAQCIELSQRMLRLLPSLDDVAPDVKNPYMGLLWQHLHYPLIAFGSLWGEIVVKSGAHPDLSKSYLEAIEHVPTFLGKSSSRNSLAEKLQSITDRFVQHARTMLNQTDEPDQAELDLSSLGQKDVESRLRADQSNPTMAPLNGEQSTETLNDDNFGIRADGLFTWPDDPFLDATFDWFSFE